MPQMPRDRRHSGHLARSQSAVLPSMSVNRKVTVPLGRSGMIRLSTHSWSRCGPIVA
jgi:hypothetical protein